MRFVAHGEVESAFPSEKADVHHDRTIYQLRLHEDLLGVVRATVVQCELSVAACGVCEKMKVSICTSRTSTRRCMRDCG